MKLPKDLTYVVLALGLIMLLLQWRPSAQGTLPQLLARWWHSSADDLPADNLTPLARPEDLRPEPPRTLAHAADTATARDSFASLREINPARFNFARLVHRGSSIDGTLLSRVLLSSSYNALINKLGESPKSMTTFEYQRQIQAFVSQPERGWLRDFRLACNDDICLCAFEAYSEDELEQFIQDFITGPDKPLKPGGFVNIARVADRHSGSTAYRLAFNVSERFNAVVGP